MPSVGHWGTRKLARLRNWGPVSLATGVAMGAVVVLSVPQAASAAPMSFLRTDFGVGGSPNSVVVADVNGDGHLDLATGNDGGGVSVLLGNGSGSFGAPTNFAAGTQASSIAAGDFNADGHVDLVVADTLTNMLLVLRGDGSGSFGTPTGFAVGTRPVALAVSEFNGDGRPDVVVANESSNNVSVLVGNSAGGFGPAKNFAVGTQPLGVAVSDFNGDLHPDVVAANGSSNNVSVLLGNSAGGFGPATNFPVSRPPSSPVAGDFNGDGHQDLGAALTGDNPSLVAVLLGNGAGGLGPAMSVVALAGFGDLVVADFDGDAIVDLAGTCCGSGSPSGNDSFIVMTGDGTGGFRRGASAGVGFQPRRPAAADLNEDGRIDAVVPSIDEATVAVLLNTTAVAVDDSFVHFGSDTPLVVAAPGFLSNDSHVGFGPVLVDGPTNGTLTLSRNDGSFTYKPREDFVGSDSFTYLLSSVGTSNTATVTITVGAGCNNRKATIVGTSGADTLAGTGAGDVIAGLGGNDHVVGIGGNDALCGGSGLDTMDGGSGNDYLDGGSGSDTLQGGSDNDRLAGGTRADMLRGGDGDDVLDGGSENDMLFGQAGADVLQGAAGDDTLAGGGGAPDECRGGAGLDTLLANHGCELVSTIP